MRAQPTAAELTVCIPAFRSGEALSFAIQSALQQHGAELLVAVSVDGFDADTLQICARFADEPRVRVTLQAQRLGWAGNVSALLRAVRTPFFCVLPHDDLLGPEFVSRLLPAMRSRPDAVVAYCDIDFQSAGARFIRGVELPDAALAERASAFFAAGGEAPPWRGITRSSVVPAHGFPTDAWDGFLVECEWAFHLLCSGPALRIPGAHFIKRLRADGGSASSARLRRPADERRAAVADHAARLDARLQRAFGAEAVPAALRLHNRLSAMRRMMALGLGAPSSDELDALAMALDEARHASPLLHARALCSLRLMQSLTGSDVEAQRTYAKQATELDPASQPALERLAQLQLAAGHIEEAADTLSRAQATIGPGHGVAALQAAVKALRGEGAAAGAMR